MITCGPLKHLLFLLGVIPFLLAGCDPESWIKPSVDVVDRDIQNAITDLSQNSSDWQKTLTNLEKQLNADGKAMIANEVTQLMQRGIATTGTELRCYADFVGTRMQQALERILAQYHGQTSTPPIPALCQVVPETLDMGNRPDHISFYGYDFDSPNGIQISLMSDSGQTDLSRWLNMPTHYIMTLDASPTSSIPLCNKENRRIVLKSQSQSIGDVGITKMQCPHAPPPPEPKPERLEFNTTQTCESGWTGCREDYVFGGACKDGYQRTRATVSLLSGNGHCEFKEWVDPNNDKDCRARAHFGGDRGSDIRCEVKIYNKGIQQAQEPDPPCPCW